MTPQLGIVYRDGGRALLWCLPREHDTVSHLTARSIFLGEFEKLSEDKISVVQVSELEGVNVELRPVFTMALGRQVIDLSPVFALPLAKVVIPDLLKSPEGPGFVAMLRREAASRI